MKLNGRILLFTLVLIIVTTACKFFLGPNLSWSGFSPVIAIALFSGMIIGRNNASFMLPLLALFLSDLAIQLLYVTGNFPYPGLYSGMLQNYLVLLIATLIGWMLKGKNYASIFGGAILAPTAFFLMSNFAVWLGSDGVFYSKDFAGLLKSYEMGLPFYRNAIIATLVFLPAIMLTYNTMVKQKSQVLVVN